MKKAIPPRSAKCVTKIEKQESWNKLFQNLLGSKSAHHDHKNDFYD